jgi:hypothetical protein
MKNNIQKVIKLQNINSIISLLHAQKRKQKYIYKENIIYKCYTITQRI